MWVIELKTNPNGSHNDHRADHIMEVPDGWAVIPDGFPVPDTFPFVSVEARDGVVVGMTACEVPAAVEPAPSQLDMIEAQVTYTAMMTDTLLEG